MKNALGLVEIKGLATAILVADTMAKTANVTITQLEKTKGLGWMTIQVVGDVGAVNAAVSAGKLIAGANQHFISSKVIPRPSDGVEVLFCQTIKDEAINITKTSAEEEKIVSTIEKKLNSKVSDGKEKKETEQNLPEKTSTSKTATVKKQKNDNHNKKE